MSQKLVKKDQEKGHNQKKQRKAEVFCHGNGRLVSNSWFKEPIHIGNDRLAQMLQQAGARKEAIDFAKNLQSDICLRHRQTAQPHLQSSYDQTKSLA